MCNRFKQIGLFFLFLFAICFYFLFVVPAFRSGTSGSNLARPRSPRGDHWSHFFFIFISQSVALTVIYIYLSNRLKPTIDMTIPLSRELRGIFILWPCKIENWNSRFLNFGASWWDHPKRTSQYIHFGNSTPYNAIHLPYIAVNDLKCAIFDCACILVLESQL